MIVCKFVDSMSIVEHVDCTVLIDCTLVGIHTRTAICAVIEVVDVLLVVANGQQVHVGTGVMCRAVSSDVVLLITRCWHTRTTLVHLLHKEVTEMWVFVTQVRNSLEVFPDNLFLCFSQRIRDFPATMPVRCIGSISPLVGVGIDASAGLIISYTGIGTTHSGSLSLCAEIGSKGVVVVKEHILRHAVVVVIDDGDIQLFLG